jgi:hypothetical protein
LNATFNLHNNFNTTFNLHNNLNAIFNLHNNINTNQRRNDTLVYCAKIYMLLNRKSASIYRYLMREKKDGDKMSLSKIADDHI